MSDRIWSASPNVPVSWWFFIADEGKFTLSSTTPLPAGAPAAVRVGDRIFTSGIVSDRTGGLESESHR
ncbi:MAG: hypothetical protein ACPHK0_04755, partial [Dehalococcoidia bacterium]